MAPTELQGEMMISPTWKTSERVIRRNSACLPVPPCRQGFTLLELLLAIGLMGLMMGLTLPNVGAVKKAYFATEEAKGVANSIRSARVDAISRRTTVALTITPERRNLLEERRLSVQSWYGGDSAGLAAGDRDWRGIWEAPVVRSTEVSGHLRLESSEPGILFFANGSSTGGEVMIHDDEGRLQHHFLIDSSTGELYVQR